MKKVIYKLLRYINYVLIISLCISYLSIYINPEKVWLFSFFGLAYPILLFINISFVIFWIIKKKRFFIIPLIIILLGWNYISSFIQIPLKKSAKEFTEQTFKILSYNVRLFDLYDWQKESKNTAREIFEYINQENPDIICFQEFYTKNNNLLSENSISKLLSSKYYFHIDYSIRNRKGNYGIATYSKYPIVKKGTIKFKNSTNLSIYTDILINKDTIRLFNNHLQSIRFNRKNYSFISNSKVLNEDERMKEIKDISFRLRDAFIKRAGQAKIVSKYINQSPHPVFICGDFNDAPISYTYHTISKNLKDSFKEAGRGFGNTYLGKFPSFRIDYILYNDKIQCSSFQIPKVKLSDHYPVIGEFYLQ
ncbi:MAG: endonuclease/exonuclease/phosphatase family protein [Bacteroidales bacterium]|nr:endonuclease/exonuclease/phosphatase family protein [Bacteroidales bacterium]